MTVTDVVSAITVCASVLLDGVGLRVTMSFLVLTPAPSTVSVETVLVFVPKDSLVLTAQRKLQPAARTV